tara:strand:+ start:3680 stop:4621 length:942 start_codon:yes stop_codon:yes gene_type:complete
MPPKNSGYKYGSRPSVIPPGKNVEREISFLPSTIETLDYALYEWLDSEMDISSTTKEGWEKVKVVWVSGERAYQAKYDKEIRDQEGSLVLPIMTLERTGMTKDPGFKGAFQSHVFPVNDYRGGIPIPAARKLNHSKTTDFQNALAGKISSLAVGVGQPNFKIKKNSKKVYNTYTTDIPTWVTANYVIRVRSHFQQQMNEMIQPFITRTGLINSFNITKDGHRFEAFFEQEFSQDNNVNALGEEERTYLSEFNIRVLGYLIGAADNDSRPKLKVRENVVEIRIQRERVITGDKPHFGQRPNVADLGEIPDKFRS